MMAVNEGRERVFTATIASAGTSSNEVDLGGYFTRVMLEIPASIASNTRILVSSTKSGSFRNLYTGLADNDTSDSVFTIASSVSNCFIAIPAPGRYVKVEATTAAANGAGYKIVGIS